MFPAGWPGVALLLLRFALAAMLLPSTLGVPINLESLWVLTGLALVAIALCVGVFTPIASVLCVAIELAAWQFSSTGLSPLHVCAIVVAIALAMLGPGGYSLDASLFGRRKIVFAARRDADEE